MNGWTRFLKSIKRKERISNFILTVGIVDVVMGGVDSRWSLMAVGLGTVGAAIVLRWWLTQSQPIESLDRPPIRYLPERSSRPSLPTLTSSRKNGE
ncbi:MAG: hypothetical protein HC769_26905 [Cyanobacteria bacterium CRU_2_1]|nr:hypothetical protein [Cyanobacteria bacterium RU_5_0]NJR62134.1 hypothetical protein [Cyanobacteria bacterium CRU_2_1]